MMMCPVWFWFKRILEGVVRNEFWVIATFKNPVKNQNYLNFSSVSEVGLQDLRLSKNLVLTGGSAFWDSPRLEASFDVPRYSEALNREFSSISEALAFFGGVARRWKLLRLENVELPKWWCLRSLPLKYWPFFGIYLNCQWCMLKFWGVISHPWKRNIIFSATWATFKRYVGSLECNGHGCQTRTPPPQEKSNPSRVSIESWWPLNKHRKKVTLLVATSGTSVDYVILLEDKVLHQLGWYQFNLQWMQYVLSIRTGQPDVSLNGLYSNETFSASQIR